MRSWIVGLVLALSAMPGSAETINGHTMCATARSIMDAEPHDQVQVKEVFNYIGSALSSIDHANVAKGGPGIIARMSPEGRNNTIAMVTARCGGHPKETLQQSVITIYAGLKSLGQAAGVDPPDEDNSVDKAPTFKDAIALKGLLLSRSATGRFTTRPPSLQRLRSLQGPE